MGRNNLPKEEVIVEVDFPVTIDKATFSKLTIDLAKNLLLQKNQIPLQFEAIAKEVELEAAQLAGDLDDEDHGDDPPSRECVRERQRRARSRRSRAQLAKHGRRLVEAVSELSAVLEAELARGGVAGVSFLFGATVHSAREVYSLTVPDNFAASGDDNQPSKRAGVHLYRAMMASEPLQLCLGSRLPVSNMFTLISRRDVHISPASASSLVHLDDYSLPSPLKCPVVSFQFSAPPAPAAPPASTAATRRLRFVSGADTQAQSHKDPGPGAGRHASGGTPKLLPQPVEPCTPFTQVRTFRPLEAEDMQLCTPAVRWRAPHPELLGSPDTMQLCTPAVSKIAARMSLCTPAVGSAASSMELCTPAVNRMPSSLEFCTPAVNIKPSSMDLCTPAVNKIPSSMELCTPAVEKIPNSSMELCTPAVSCIRSDMELCTPAVLPVEDPRSREEESGSMDLCTPEDQAKEPSRRKEKLSEEDSFEVKTPEISNLSLESPNKKTKVSHGGPDEDLKDSGISSPELSRREESKCDILQWFVIEAPIRGFKHKRC